MARKNDIASFFYYMWNCWDEHECAVAFEKANLDDRNQNLLVERALEMYSGKKRIK